MLFKLKIAAYRLRAEPRKDADKIVLLDSDILLEKKGKDTADGWSKVQARLPVGDWPIGFVPKRHLKEAEVILPDEEIDLKRFVDVCTRASRVVNAEEPDVEYGVHRNYLIAVAWIESRIRNIKSEHSEAFGPFQFLPSTWKDFLDQRGGRAQGFNEGHLFKPFAQCFGAARYTFDSTAHLSKALTKSPEPVDGPYIPNSIEVYLAHLLGRDGATEILRVKDKKTSIKTPLDKVFKAKTDKVISANRGLLANEDGSPATIEAVLDTVEKEVDIGLAKAAELVAIQRPQDEPVSQTEQSNKPPWMVAAEKELAKNIKEKGSPPNKEIIKYFKATTYNTTNEEPWCVAFVSWCMKNSGSKIIEKSNLRSARAADWMIWGNAGPHPKYGALAVLSPLAKGASGHVGFVTDLTKTHVKLLGGNQGDALKISSYSVNKVRSYRWMNWEIAIEEETDSSSTLPQFRPLLDFLGKYESQNNYNAYFSNTSNEDNPRFVSMTVDQVIAWQKSFVSSGSKSSAVGKYQIIRKTLKGLKDSMNLTGNELFDKGLQDRMAVQLMKGRHVDRYLNGEISAESFANNLAREWASMPVTTGPKKGKSYYSGDGLNKSLVSVPKFLEAVRAIKT